MVSSLAVSRTVFRCAWSSIPKSVWNMLAFSVACSFFSKFLNRLLRRRCWSCVTIISHNRSRVITRMEKVDWKFDVFLARWEDADPVIRMVIILSFVLSQFPKMISAVKVDWLCIFLEILSVDLSVFLGIVSIIMGVLLWFTLSVNLLNSPASAILPIRSPG